MLETWVKPCPNPLPAAINTNALGDVVRMDFGSDARSAPVSALGVSGALTVLGASGAAAAQACGRMNGHVASLGDLSHRMAAQTDQLSASLKALSQALADLDLADMLRRARLIASLA
ncbi:MAG TPA: hypothetical protein VEH84_14500 [Alphaproteobacteria bacterium]|nr:hypothetical protein [Alphaproteobacteria bacterium]